MKKSIASTNLNGLIGTHDFELEVPSQCPCCSTALSPTILNSFYISSPSLSSGSSDIGKLFLLCFCPKCEECFLAHYTVSISNFDHQSVGFLTRLTPHSGGKTTFSDGVTSLSPLFVTIYNQAEEAESMGLSEICGLGYRKSLEFLVKDYAIHLHPENENSIKNQSLSPCIAENIDNQKIRALSTASAWIGNDETHYVRKHESYNVNHLKAFIHAVVSFIDSDLSYEEAISLLSK